MYVDLINIYFIQMKYCSLYKTGALEILHPKLTLLLEPQDLALGPHACLH